MIRKHLFFSIVAFLLIAAIFSAFCSLPMIFSSAAEETRTNSPIKWMSFDPPESAMNDAIKADIESQEKLIKINWIDLLSLLAAKYWGEWKRYQKKDLQAYVTRLQNGEKIKEISASLQKFPYFSECYHAVLDGFVGDFLIGTSSYDVEGNTVMQSKYGLRAYSPIAYGYSYSHYKDFGASRSFGFSRRHLGNDLMASVGTPIIAVESGIVTKCGWNRYGGWRIGILSFDKKRYYYYAHLRKGHPFTENIKEGSIVKAGDPIGYVGMTGYSDQEDVNGMKVPHLHFGMQIIFDESQLEGNNEIWIDVYQIIELLEHHKSPVVHKEKSKGTQDVQRKYPFEDPSIPAETDCLSTDAYFLPLTAPRIKQKESYG